MIAAYAVLDGFDLGAGAIHLLVARTDLERQQVIHSIGPVWDANEVWLIASGGALFLAFPNVYAAAFSGFYLPLIIVLWLLILRGIAIEFRHHVESLVWQPFWDVVFAGASALLAGLFGTAVGNVVRGVPLDREGFFFLPLWTNLLVGKEVGILDWYTVMFGLASFFALTVHGALWVAMKTEGALEERSRAVAGWAWWATLALTILVVLLSPWVRPHLANRYLGHPIGFVFPLATLAAMVGAKLLNRTSTALEAFLCSSLYVVGILVSAAFGIYPYLLPSNTDPALALTVSNSAASAYGLRVALTWFVPGILLVATYFVVVYRNIAGKVRLSD